MEYLLGSLNQSDVNRPSWGTGPPVGTEMSLQVLAYDSNQ